MPNDVNVVNISFVRSESACSLGPVVAFFALVPHDADVVNMLFVLFEVVFLLGFEVA